MPPTAQTETQLPEERSRILKMVQNHAEEPDDIEYGEGTFTTFRVEYLLDDIVQEFQRVRLQRDAELFEQIKQLIIFVINGEKELKAPEQSSHLGYYNQAISDVLKLLKEEKWLTQHKYTHYHQK